MVTLMNLNILRRRVPTRLERGMTLIEILVVLVLIGGIVFSILLGVMGMSELVG